jgi:23S rRNA (guanosine2251-2'-O)-methyltransferase
MTEGSDPSPILGDIDRLAREAHVPVRLVSQRRLESVQGTEAPQGVVAFAEALSAASLDELVLGWSEGTSDEEPLGDEVSMDGDEDIGAIEHESADLDDDDGHDDDDDDDDDDGFFIDLGEFEEAVEDGEVAVVVQVADDEDLTDAGETLIVPGASSETDHDEATEEAHVVPDIDAADAAAAVIDVATLEAVVRSSRRKPTPAAPEETSGTAFLVLLEGVTDPQNLGAILRSAECAGVTGVAVPRHRSVHVTPAVTKAAAGAIEHLQMALVSGIPSALQQLAQLGVKTVGLDERGTSSLYDLKVGDRPVALVLGSEATGLSPLARRRCDVLCRIPVGGEIPSLNVSAAAAVACFEVARQRQARTRT